MTACKMVASILALCACSGGNRAGKTESATITVRAPYTAAQVTAGSAVYAKYCLSCHGARLQGLSAPALTGSAFARADLNVSQIYTVVTQQMPLLAPGSLSKANYAAVIAYILAYDCVKPDPGGKLFPTSSTPQLASIKPTDQTCPP
jgi:mono/diheme cytochrome c family protein